MTSQPTNKQSESEPSAKMTKKEIGSKVVNGATTGMEWLSRIIVGGLSLAVGCGLLYLVFAVPGIEFMYKAGLVIVAGLALWNGINAFRGASYWAVL